MSRSALFITLVLILGAAQALQAETHLYTRARSNMRSGPSTSHKVVKVVPLGASVRVGQLKGGWYEVLNPGNEVVGYIYADLLRSEKSGQGSVIGQWEGDVPGMGRGKFEQYTLMKNGNRYRIIRNYFDGSEGGSDLIPKKVGDEVRYYKTEDAYVEYYVIHRNGDLGLYDKVGLIRTVAPVAQARGQ